MKNIIQILCIGAMLIFSSCSTVVERMPAEADNKIFNQAFSFSAIETSDYNFEEEVKKNASLYATSNEGGIKRVEQIKVKSLPEGAIFKVELGYEEKTGVMLYKIHSTPKAYKDIGASSAVMNFVINLLQGPLGDGSAGYELYYNAEAGDPIALDNVLKLRTIAPAQQLSQITVYNNDPLYKEGLKEVEAAREELKDKITLFKKKRVAAKAKRKSLLNTLDKAPEGKQFRVLVAKNDRKGAAEILKKYLPWEEMAPFEKQYWETYLDVMANPVPLDQRVLIYRGLNSDYINRGIVSGKELSEKEAIKTDRAFIMSSGMIKNQGSWNRRLRTLEAMNDKIIATIGGNDDYAQSIRITTMFNNHSVNPQGSPFISFTSKIGVAESFGLQRTSSYLIDPRLLSFNYASSFTNEVEYLVPITTFPDELIAIADVNLMHEEDPTMDNRKYLEKKLEQHIVDTYGKSEKDAVITRIKKNSYQFFRLRDDLAADVKGPAAGPANLKFYKTFLTKDDPKPALSPKGELTCKDLIELFWVVE
ncbi:MAG: hypothetical protein H7336_13045 [Bacteriovorax sp.]|nr:hypothetical protein [Bacteriovorax sp.]